MILEFYQRRRTNFPTQYTYIAGPGICYRIQYQDTLEIPDEHAYQIIAKDPDIVREYKGAKKKTASKTKVSKRKKVVENYTTA